MKKLATLNCILGHWPTMNFMECPRCWDKIARQAKYDFSKYFPRPSEAVEAESDQSSERSELLGHVEVGGLTDDDYK